MEHMDCAERRVDGQTVYKGVIVNVTLDKVLLSDGSETRREVVHHSGGVTVLPVEDDGTVWCVRQFRYPFGQEILEAPAGKLEIGEEPESAALRELSEETGLRADKLVYLGPNLSSPGYSTEVLHIYLALGLHEGEAHLDEGEFLNIEKHKLDELYDLAMRGELTDGKTVVAVLKAKNYLEAN